MTRPTPTTEPMTPVSCHGFIASAPMTPAQRLHWDIAHLPHVSYREPHVSYRELFVCWASNPGEYLLLDHEHRSDIDCDWGWVCNTDGCTHRVDETPCPEHAPLTPPPGLRLVECQAKPRHWLFAHDRDDYGYDCPACDYEREYEDLLSYRLAAERRQHRWCRLLNPAKRAAVRLRIARWRGLTSSHACCHRDIRWRWTR